MQRPDFASVMVFGPKFAPWTPSQAAESPPCRAQAGMVEDVSRPDDNGGDGDGESGAL
jgi:hypothetical protein